MTEKELKGNFARLDVQFEFHLRLWQWEQKLIFAETEQDKRLIKKQIQQLEKLKRISGL